MRTLAALIAAALVAVPTAQALDVKQASALLRLASKASGLKPRAQVRIVVEKPGPFAKRRVQMLDRTYPRQAQEHDEDVFRALGLLSGKHGVLRQALIEMQNRTGFYDHVRKTTYVRRGATERAAALHELVHALQDQHFGIGRLFALRNARDAKVAALAAVEGHARLVSDVVAPRRLQAHGGPRLARYLALERGFIYDVGLRFAADLRNLGGTQAVRGTLKRFPQTSEQVFHLDKYLERERAKPVVLPVDAAGFTLASTNTFGELDVRALLAVFAVPRLDHVGTGWGGGRSAVYRRGMEDAVAIALDWDTERDALEWAEAVTIYVNEAFDAATPGLPEPVACEASVCWQPGASGVAFARTGTRTVLVLSRAAETSAAVARALVPAA
jgi:hypothetical protein